MYMYTEPSLTKPLRHKHDLPVIIALIGSLQVQCYSRQLANMSLPSILFKFVYVFEA